MKHSLFLLPLMLLILLAACETPEWSGVPTVPITATSTRVPEAAATATTSLLPTKSTVNSQPLTPTPTFSPDSWKSMPVVPVVSQRMIEIYRRGQELGNNPQSFSKIGDCESTPTWFLGQFDGKPTDYSLGSYTELQPVIDAFHGSFGRTSLAAGRGFSAANVLTPLWADRTYCEINETPLDCEVRLNRPAFTFVMLGTNDVYHLDTFDANMRQILDILIEQGVVSILSTKADNLEGDQAINLTIARLAYEYDLPLWNFWMAVQPLPGHGLQEDGSHLTWAGSYFDDPARMRNAWPWRNLTALQVLQTVWQAVAGTP